MTLTFTLEKKKKMGSMDWMNLTQWCMHSCEKGNEPLGSIRCWDILECWRNRWLH
jgi:hypothetical protein